MNPFEHSPEAGLVYTLLENVVDDQNIAGELAILIINELRRAYTFVPKRKRNQPKIRKWK